MISRKMHGQQHPSVSYPRFDLIHTPNFGDTSTLHRHHELNESLEIRKSKTQQTIPRTLQE